MLPHDYHRRLSPGTSSNIHSVQHLRLVIIHSLDTLNLANAEFAAERLLALDLSRMDSLYLYCLVLFRQGNYKSCYNRLINTLALEDWGCAYIFARSCLNIDRHKEGLFLLLSFDFVTTSADDPPDAATKNAFLLKNLHTLKSLIDMHSYEFKRSIYPDVSAVYHLVGDLYAAVLDTTNSAIYYSRTLTFNQYDFEAFQKLCRLGVDVSVKGIYQHRKATGVFSNAYYDHDDFNRSAVSHLAPSKVVSEVLTDVGDGIHNPFSSLGTAHPSAETSTGGDDPTHTISRSRSGMGTDIPLQKTNFNISNTPNHFDFVKPSNPSDPSQNTEKKPRRESAFSKITSRLISQPMVPADHASETINTSTKHAATDLTEGKRPTGHRTPALGLRPGLQHENGLSSFMNYSIKGDIEKSDRRLLNLYIIFAKAYRRICKYDCYKAIRILESLPESERETCWVLSKLGRLHYEIVNYKQSERFFVKLRLIDRTRLRDMEFYLTLLWHLHRKVELTYLANELHELDPQSPITWCVIGNLFSLNREPDEAIRCFSKANRLDDKFAYAYTLKGHEYFGNDNYEMALDSFRLALLLDPRHYNALYGIGMVYINLGDYQRADFHFRKAVAINPINIILICCVGMVMEKLGKKNLALRQYELASKLQPLNPLPLFKKAQLLFSEQQFPQALDCFLILKDLAPDEALVHFLLGQLYNIQNKKYCAIREFTIALNLDPKGNYLIREAMESLKE